MTTAITVENLGKRYRIGHEVKRATSAKEMAKNAALASFRYLKYRLSPMTEADTLWACRNISFEVKEGEVLGIIGANGAGKSTLLKLLSRITDPTEGRAIIRGRVNALLEVGVGFHPELTGRENIYMNAALHGLTTREIRARMDEIVDFAGVERFLDTPVKRYSSGMKVRLGFAVAANLDPEILIVDEVLAVGDVSFQHKCLGKLQDVTKTGRTVLFVSHNMSAIQNMCGRSILLERGGIGMTGKTDEVIQAYVEQQVPGFAQCPSISGPAELLIKQLGEDGKARNTLRTGDPIRWVAELKVSRPIRQPLFIVRVCTVDHVCILTFNTKHQYAASWEIKDHVRITLDWPECILNQGAYMLNIFLAEHRTAVGRWEGIHRFNVIDSDYFGTGRMPDPRSEGKVVSRANWAIDRSS